MAAYPTKAPMPNSDQPPPYTPTTGGPPPTTGPPPMAAGFQPPMAGPKVYGNVSLGSNVKINGIYVGQNPTGMISSNVKINGMAYGQQEMMAMNAAGPTVMMPGMMPAYVPYAGGVIQTPDAVMMQSQQSMSNGQMQQTVMIPGTNMVISQNMGGGSPTVYKY